MAIKARPETEKVADHDIAAERGYASWKRAKVEVGLEQSKDRDTLIPAEEVWADVRVDPSRSLCHAAL